MSPGLTGPLGTDFEVMTSVAGRIDVLNDDVRAMLQSFIGKMSRAGSIGRCNTGLLE
ncbi:hypothetical protein ABFV47_24750 [Mycolicibacterium fortuitum]|uniref:hypothetical protein n=1 Tax=Mycolicibacterium fortuitum TaxID=1766 RepID=UPI003A87DF6D